MEWTEENCKKRVGIITAVLREETKRQKICNGKFDCVSARENLYYFLSSVYAYLFAINGQVNGKDFFNYLMEYTRYVYLVSTMDFHLVNTARLKFDGKDEMPYLLCERMRFLSEEQEEQFLSYLGIVTRLKDYTRLLKALESCYDGSKKPNF